MANDCIFCRIAAGELPAKKAYEDDEILAFHDINPKAPVHLLVIPKKHIPTYMDVSAEDLPLMGRIHAVIQKLARECKLDDGFRVVNNCGKGGGQEVYHLHFHLLGGGKIQPFPTG